jgi:kexin
VSKRTQIWIYGALALIIVFVAGLGTYFFIARRKRIKDSRDAYEFEVLDGDEDRDDAGLLAGAAGRKKRAKRGGELYDAFAGESDEDPYRDQDRFNEKYTQDEASEEEGSGSGASSAGKRQ